MSDKSTYGKNMLLVSSYYGEHNSFKMVPVTEDCPYVECIYDPKINFLVLIGKISKHVLKMLEKLDDNGAPVPVKNFNPQVHKQQHKVERKHLEVFQEYSQSVGLNSRINKSLYSGYLFTMLKQNLFSSDVHIRSILTLF